MSINHVFPIRQGPGSEQSSFDLSTLLNDWLQKSGPDGLFRTCGSCRAMARDGEPTYCKKFGMTPPIDIVLKGCDAHEDEAQVPF